MSGMVRRDVIKAANERAQANAPRDDLAARIVHRLSCTRCAQGWSCGGLGEGDYAAAGEIAGLLAEVWGEERERVVQAIEAESARLHAAFASDEDDHLADMRNRLGITLEPGHWNRHDDGCGMCGLATAARIARTEAES